MILALLLMVAAPRWDLQPLVEKVENDLEAWDIEGARKGLDDLVADHPDAPETAYFRGRVLFEQGQYAEAVTAFEAAGGGREFKKGASQLVSDLKLAKAAAEETAGDETFESAHFVLKTRPGKDTLLAPYALEALERAYTGLTRDLGLPPGPKIRVEVYDSARSLAHVSPLTVEEIKASGTIALCKYNRLMITSPKALLRGYPWLDTLSHEFVHYLVTRKGRNSVPIWLQEGLAKFLETRWRGAPGLAVDDLSLKLLQLAAKKNTLIPFAKMHPSIAKLPTQEQAALAFAEVEAAIRLLYERGGQTALTELVAAMAHGFTDEEAVAQAYGKSFREFEADWRREVAKPRAKAVSDKNVRPAVARKLVFKEDAKGKTEPAQLQSGAPEPVATGDNESKKAVRLGEILFARRRWGAAAREYAKARARLDREVPQVSRRYAFAQIQVGNWDEARIALQSAIEKDPEDEAAQALLARVLIEKKEWQGARTALDQGIAVDPFDPELHGLYVAVAKGLSDRKLEDREAQAWKLASGVATPKEKASKEGP